IILKEQGYSWENCNRILDFACGCGRVTRLLLKYADRCEIAGSDVNNNHIEWLNGNFPFGKFFVNNFTPPTRFEAKYFDLVFCVSLFSHLNESNQFQWLNELLRITRAGGLIIITTHGQRSLEVLNMRSDIRETIGI